MFCPVCGAEIPEGSLYCEKCGEDIHIVPDFEPEVDQEIRESMESVMSLFKPAKRKDNNKKFILYYTSAFVFILFFVLTAGIIYINRSVELKVYRAERAADRGDFEKAVSIYLSFLDSDVDYSDADVYLKISELYQNVNNKPQYEYYLRKAIQSSEPESREYEYAFSKLLEIYAFRDDFYTVSELLSACKNDKILKMYADVSVSDPEFDLSEGEYNTVIPLKLSSKNDKADIYYTLDGSVPDENSLLYTTPILLEEGDICVSAVCINRYGLKSGVVVKNYRVDVEFLPDPEVDCGSGDYHVPTLISIEGDFENVYYTTDGSEPDFGSNVFTDPIPMPLGNSIFKFKRLGNDKESNTLTFNYNLVIDDSYGLSKALEDVKAYAVLIGRTVDENGYIDDSHTSSYTFSFVNAQTIENVGDFYVFREIYNENGVSANTGHYYGAECHGGGVRSLIIEGVNNYSVDD
ncbi:MAG: chitobiase/beta-hexosaminidase C-terminal domain-containing protein [Acetatifactor sp.]|nr:chitobiase/beta-hexosaminidase C-terminal domain-containing protein [Acetatifactor sp.]